MATAVTTLALIITVLPAHGDAATTNTLPPARLVEMVRHGTLPEQLEAAHQMGRSGDASFVPILNELIERNDVGEPVSQAACLARARLRRPTARGSRADVQYLLDTAEQPCPSDDVTTVRRWAVRQLAELGDEALLPEMERLLLGPPESPADDGTLLATYTLRVKHAARGTPGLLEAMRSPDRGLAGWAINRIRAEKRADALPGVVMLVEELHATYIDLRREHPRDAPETKAFFLRWGSLYPRLVAAVKELGGPDFVAEARVIRPLWRSARPPEPVQ